MVKGRRPSSSSRYLCVSHCSSLEPANVSVGWNRADPSMMWSTRKSPSCIDGTLQLGLLRSLDRRVEARQVDHDAFLRAAGEHDDGLLGERVLLPVRDPRRHEDVVAGIRLDAPLPAVLQEHEHRSAGDDIDTRLRLTVMVVAGARPSVDTRLT